MEEIHRIGVERALDQAIERATDGVDGLYVSFDLDSVDASAFPGTGTPEPGGFTARETLAIARSLGRARPIAMDLVEIAPIYDLSGISARLACAVALELLSGAVGH
jgi:agmatinase